MKYEWRKQDKELYIPKTTPIITTIPSMSYVLIHGEGNPNSVAFSTCVAALYAISYGVKMALKKEKDVPDYTDYTVFPLEGEWSLTEAGIKLYNAGTPITELKDFFSFVVMIRQPKFVSTEFVEQIKQSVFTKKKNERVLEVSFETLPEIEVCQMLHLGSYDSEPESFKRMEEYCRMKGYQRTTKKHKEIYLSDPSKVESAKLKTTLRFKVESKM